MQKNKVNAMTLEPMHTQKKREKLLSSLLLIFCVYTNKTIVGPQNYFFLNGWPVVAITKEPTIPPRNANYKLVFLLTLLVLLDGITDRYDATLVPYFGYGRLTTCFDFLMLRFSYEPFFFSF